MPDLAESLLQIGSPERAASVVHEMLSSSEHLDDPSLQARARLWSSVVQSVVDPKSTSVDQLRNVAEDAARVFEELGEPANIASALAELAWTYWLTGDSGLMMKISQRAMQLASDSGNRLALTVCAEYAGRAMVLGSTPCEEGVRLMAALQRAHADDRLVVAPIQLALAVLLAMMGRFDEARNKMTQAQRVFEDLGQRRWVAAAAGTSGLITWWQGHPEAAELDMRSSYEFFRERGESAPPPEASNLARLLYELDRLDEADSVTETIVQGSPAYQLESQIEWRGVRAKILARRGETEAAEKLAREAVDLARPTDFLSLIGRASLDLAECLHLAGQVDEAERVARDSLESFQRKGDTVGAARARALRELVGRPPSR